MDSFHEAKRILVAEDNPALRRVICFSLEKAGYEVTAACNGREAWDFLQEEAYHLVVTDQQMPEMNGWDLCLRIRESSDFRSIPVIFLTAKELELDMPRMKKDLGVRTIFAKPFSPTELVRAVGDELATPLDVS